MALIENRVSFASNTIPSLSRASLYLPPGQDIKDKERRSGVATTKEGKRSDPAMDERMRRSNSGTAAEGGQENSFRVIKLFAFGKFIYLCLVHSRNAYPPEIHRRVSSISINILFNEFATIPSRSLCSSRAIQHRRQVHLEQTKNKNNISNEEMSEKSTVQLLLLLLLFRILKFFVITFNYAKEKLNFPHCECNRQTPCRSGRNV